MGVRRPSRQAAAGAVALAAVLSAGPLLRAPEGQGRTQPRAGVPLSAARLPTTRLYSRHSPFNRRIPRMAAFSSASDAMIGGLSRTAADEGAVLAWREYTVPLFLAGRRRPIDACASPLRGDRAARWWTFQFPRTSCPTPRATGISR